jgi:hypothetical protein
MERCHMFINMIKGLQFMKANPGTVATIQKDHLTFVRHKPWARPGMHALGSSDLPDPDSPDDADDRPSLNFDNNGYICHLADDSAVHDTDDVSSTGELSVHSNPCDPLIDFDDADSPYHPDMDDYLIANIVDVVEADVPSSYEATLDLLTNEGMDTQDDPVEQGKALLSSPLPLVDSAIHF